MAIPKGNDRRWISRAREDIFTSWFPPSLFKLRDHLSIMTVDAIRSLVICVMLTINQPGSTSSRNRDRHVLWSGSLKPVVYLPDSAASRHDIPSDQ